MSDAPEITSDEFRTTVQEFLDEGRPPKILAAEFEVAVSTVIRWARGTANPAKHLRRAIVEWIRST